jgi:Tfp pilus assembly protein PilO
MKPPDGSLRMNRFVIGAAALLLVGLGIDFGIAQPQLRANRRLIALRESKLADIAQISRHQQEVRELARSLGSDDLASAMASRAAVDPLSFLGRSMERTRLTQSALSSRATTETQWLRRTSYSLRATGSYEEILQFVRLMETGPRLVSIDGLALSRIGEDGDLEGRFDLSIYEPKTGAAQ